MYELNEKKFFATKAKAILLAAAVGIFAAALIFTFVYFLVLDKERPFDIENVEICLGNTAVADITKTYGDEPFKINVRINDGAKLSKRDKY